MKFRKKPVVIEAIQWTGVNINELSGFMKEYPRIIDRKIRIKTLEGSIYAKETDWIIKGVEGEFYPCDNNIFEKTYEKVEK